ncbi:hypothetical protein D3C76_1475570 [compost metagenome]
MSLNQLQYKTVTQMRQLLLQLTVCGKTPGSQLIPLLFQQLEFVQPRIDLSLMFAWCQKMKHSRHRGVNPP